MGALLRMPPKPHAEMVVKRRRKRNLGNVETKPHSEMKIGKSRAKMKKSPQKKKP